MVEHGPIRLGLIGLGKQGLEHLQASPLCRDVDFVAGVDPSPTQQQLALALQPQLQLRERIADLADLALDGLVLALPHHCYADCWPEILALGLPLLKEKPLGRTLDEARRFIAQAKAAGCPIQTAIQRRHHPSYVRLAELMRERRLQVSEAHAHMHLGFNLANGSAAGWRSSRRHSGGGALLDSGYHMVDLLHFLIGPFELVSVALWRNQLPLSSDDVDDQAWLLGRSAKTWVYVDSYVGGSKSERLVLQTDQGTFSANRQGVWHEQTLIENFDHSWGAAMAQQLTTFAANIRAGNWSDPMIWDQLPAMELIDTAYHMANRH